MDRQGVQLAIPGTGVSLAEKVDLAIRTIQFWEYKALELDPDGYYLGFSGGKDSVVLYSLAQRSGVQFAAHYHVTTIDPPELVKFIRAEYPEVIWDRPKKGALLRNIPTEGLPTRRLRWCCKQYKEGGGTGLMKLLGIRAAESGHRANNWKTLTVWRRGGGYVLNPILHWTDQDVWEYIHQNGIKYCSLYDEGFHRLGCVGCPMAGRKGRLAEFARWPKLEAAWKKACKKFWERRAGKINRKGKEWFGSAHFSCWEELWEWWLSDDGLPKEDCNMGLW